MHVNLDKFRQLNWQNLDKTAGILLFLCTLYLCWKLASLFWLLLAPMQAMQFERVQLGSQQQSVPNIANFALFPSQGNMQQQLHQLNLTLHGVVIGSPRQLSSAVIKANNVAERYRVGEFIADTPYQLSEVYWDKVILRNQTGASQMIKMAGIENLNQDVSQAKNNMTANTATSVASNPQAAIGQAVQQIQDNRDQYLQNMGVSSSGGEGYEVTARTPLLLRRKLNLQPGDRILSLNGQRLGAGQNEAQLLEQARQSGQVKLEIQRGEQVVTIQQDLN